MLPQNGHVCTTGGPKRKPAPRRAEKPNELVGQVGGEQRMISQLSKPTQQKATERETLELWPGYNHP